MKINIKSVQICGENGFDDFQKCFGYLGVRVLMVDFYKENINILLSAENTISNIPPHEVTSTN